MGLSNFDSCQPIIAQLRFVRGTGLIRMFRDVPKEPTFSTTC
jgi:hypothetical protein